MELVLGKLVNVRLIRYLILNHELPVVQRWTQTAMLFGLDIVIRRDMRLVIKMVDQHMSQQIVDQPIVQVQTILQMVSMFQALQEVVFM